MTSEVVYRDMDSILLDIGICYYIHANDAGRPCLDSIRNICKINMDKVNETDQLVLTQLINASNSDLLKTINVALDDYFRRTGQKRDLNQQLRRRKRRKTS